MGKKNYEDGLIYFEKKLGDRLKADALDTYYWLATIDKKIAKKFGEKAVQVENKLEKMFKENNDKWFAEPEKKEDITAGGNEKDLSDEQKFYKEEENEKDEEPKKSFWQKLIGK